MFNYICKFLIASVFLSHQCHASLFWGFGIEGYPIEAQQLIKLTEETLIKPQIISFYIQWPGPNESKVLWPKSSLENIWQIGAVPSITWEPMYYIRDKRIIIPSKEILDGKYDGYILEFAKSIKEFAKPVIIRFGHEMNLVEYRWGEQDESNYGKGSPENYKKIFQYVVDKFRKVSADNALWAFCPNVDSIPNETWNLASNYYPGDAYVDLLGMDGYDWGNPSRPFKDIFLPLFQQIKAISPGKPIFIFETAIERSAAERTNWIKEAITASIEWQIKGLVWFQANKEKDWRIGRTLGDNVDFIKSNTRNDAQKWAQEFKK